MTPSRVTRAVRMKTKGNKKARMRMVWKRVLYEICLAATLIFIKSVKPLLLDIVTLLMLGEK